MKSGRRDKPQRHEEHRDFSDESLCSSCLCGFDSASGVFAKCVRRFCLAIFFGAVLLPITIVGAEQNPEAGLILSVKSAIGGSADLSVVQGVSLFVPAASAVSPFVAA